ncbi:hypothetical protein TorRG33x02_164820, partial [Trema orientale]
VEATNAKFPGWRRIFDECVGMMIFSALLSYSAINFDNWTLQL